MPACGEWAWYHPEHGHQRFFCGSGNCHRGECKTLFWKRRIRLISALIEQYGLIRFFTLTLDPEFIQGDPWVYIHDPWVKFRHRMNRRFPGWRFVAVLERHKQRDVPHIHGFTDVWLRQVDWSTMWEQCRGGKIVWIEKVETPDASSYVSKQLQVAKYVGKEQIKASYKVDKQLRTLWRSKDTKADFELTSDEGWCILKENVYREDGEFTDYFAKRGVWSGQQKEQGRQDMETTCGTLSPDSSAASISHVETPKGQDQPRQTGEVTGHASEDQ